MSNVMYVLIGSELSSAVQDPSIFNALLFRRRLGLDGLLTDGSDAVKDTTYQWATTWFYLWKSGESRSDFEGEKAIGG